MSDQSKHYDYYKVEGETVKALIDGYSLIGEQRQQIIQQAVERVGAKGYTKSSGWGDCGDLLSGFCWSEDFEFPCAITVKSRDYLDGILVIVARGKGNTKEGRAYNKELDTVKADVNAKLSSLPSWKSYIINHYGIMRTGIGSASGRGFGMAMLSTYGGMHPGRDDCLVFAIPNNTEERHGDIVIPDDFQKLTYGQFYDIVNTTSE